MENLSQVIMQLIVLSILTTLLWSWLSSPILNLFKLKKENQELKYKLKELSVSDYNKTKDLLPELIRLCHPDKHDNSSLSNKVTKWLLSQK